MVEGSHFIAAHHGAVGFVFLKVLTDPVGRDHRGRVERREWCGVLLGNHFELGNEGVHRDGEHHPENDDRYREDAQHVREERPFRLGRYVFLCGGCHPDFTRQKVWALPPTARRSSKTRLSILIRQPISLLLPCTIMLPITAGSTVTT